MIGRNYVPRLVESLDDARMVPQINGYFLELGPPMVGPLLSHLKDQDAVIRANVAQILGAIGGEAAIAALEPLLQDRDQSVVTAATRAIERAKMTHR
jgi:HEAT repeat protein